MRLVILIPLAIISGAVFYQSQPSNKLEYWDMGAVASHGTNQCISGDDQFSEVVKIEYEYMEDAIGKWYPLEQVIMLNPNNGMDIDTVAHEVSHMVDTFTDRYNLSREHQAYAQGHWTRCVWDVVSRDLQSTSNYKFRSDLSDN